MSLSVRSRAFGSRQARGRDGPEAARRLSADSRCLILASFLALEVSLERIQEEPIVRDREPEGVPKRGRSDKDSKWGQKEHGPVEDLLLLLRSDAVVAEEEIEEWRLAKRETGQHGKSRHDR